MYENEVHILIYVDCRLQFIDVHCTLYIQIQNQTKNKTRKTVYFLLYELYA